MKTSMIAVLLSAGVLIGALYSLPKVIVNDKNKTGSGIATENPASDSVNHLSNNHTIVLSAAQLSTINRLRKSYLADISKEKKLRFADSLAILFAQVGKPDSSALYMEAIAVLEPTTPNLLSAGNSYYDAFGFAVDTEKANRFGEKAREYFQKVLDKNPSILEAKTKMAMTFVSTSNPMQGILLLREVIAEDPKNELALFNLGLLSIRSNQYGKAIDRFLQIVQLNPDNMQAQYYLGVCYIETGKKEEARKVFNLVKLKEADPAVQASVAEYLKKLN
ncbi:MAG: tetratricopeptide repeat protein [Bacteroidota bacterium]